MRYYTNVFRSGNKLFVREIRDGKRRKFKIEYQPTLYVPSNKNSAFKAPDGTSVEPMKPGSMGDCYQFLNQYKDVANFRVYGNTQYEYGFINEEYPGIINYNINEMSVCNLDIEVESKQGYSTPEDPTQPVIAITVKNSLDGIFHVFACKSFENALSEVKYYECEDEMDLLEQFLTLWEKMQPDIVTGWNIRLYDIPYLINRISRIMTEDDANRLSPWGIIKQSTVNIFGKPNQVFDVAGLNILDYLLIYRKNVLEPRESYRLEYIAQVELGEGKVDYGEYGSLQALYERNFQKFVEYNIHDVRLVDRIDAKRKLIELQLIVAYDAKVNFVDVLSQVRVWDTKITNHLLANGVVVPQKSGQDKDAQFAGAFVMKPIIGMHEWVAAFDVTSLYPTIMRTLNMGIETKLTINDLTSMMRQYASYIHSNLMMDDDEGKPIVNVATITDEDLLTTIPQTRDSNGKPIHTSHCNDWDKSIEQIKPNVTLRKGMTVELNEHMIEEDVACAANAVFYRREPKSFYSVMIEDLFNARITYRNKATEAKKELSTCTDAAKKAELQGIISNFDLKQKATKIQLNSLYGAMGNQYFRFFDVKNAEAVTLTGQFIIQFIGQSLDKYLNKKLKTEGVRYVIYSDTDSVYVTLDAAVKKFAYAGEVMEKCDFVDKLCKEALQPEINRLFKIITQRYLNGVGDHLKMARELIGDKAIWTAKKRYLINVRDMEGIRKDPAELKYMGVEIAKSSVPKFCREAMKEAVTIVMNKDRETLYKYVADTKKLFKKQPIEDVSFPRSVNGLAKYGDPVSVYTKGTPFHTKGALFFNHLIDQQKLSSRYPKIREGEKIKFCYMSEPNPLNSTAIAFPTKLPQEFELDRYIDWEMQWSKSFLEPLQLILNAIGWDTERRASLDELFGD